MNAVTTSMKARRYRGADEGERKAERRRRLIDAAIECFGGEGYQAASVRSICAIAGLTERYFYESFSNREDLLGDVYDWIVDSLRVQMRAALADAEATAEARSRTVLEVYFTRIEENPSVARVLLFEILGVGPAIDQRYNAAMDELADLLASAARPQEDMRGARSGLFGMGLAGAVVIIAGNWVLGGYRRPRAEIVSHCTSLLVTLGAAAAA